MKIRLTLVRDSNFLKKEENLKHVYLTTDRNNVVFQNNSSASYYGSFLGVNRNNIPPNKDCICSDGSHDQVISTVYATELETISINVLPVSKRQLPKNQLNGPTGL